MYNDLPTSLGAADAGKGYWCRPMVKLYVWDGAAFPANRGRGVHRPARPGRGRRATAGPQRHSKTRRASRRATPATPAPGGQPGRTARCQARRGIQGPGVTPGRKVTFGPRKPGRRQHRRHPQGQPGPDSTVPGPQGIQPDQARPKVTAAGRTGPTGSSSCWGLHHQ